MTVKPSSCSVRADTVQSAPNSCLHISCTSGRGQQLMLLCLLFKCQGVTGNSPIRRQQSAADAMASM